MINLHCGEAGRFSEVISGDETDALVVLEEEGERHYGKEGRVMFRVDWRGQHMHGNSFKTLHKSNQNILSE